MDARLDGPHPDEPGNTGVLAKAFGDDLWRAISSVGWDRGAFDWVLFSEYDAAIQTGTLLIPETIDLAKVHLYGDDQSKRYGAALFASYLASTYPEQLDELESVVPYLVRAMANSTWTDADSTYADALKGITGQSFGEDVSAWWEWWEQR